jgi:hypothetical protein
MAGGRDVLLRLNWSRRGRSEPVLSDQGRNLTLGADRCSSRCAHRRINLLAFRFSGARYTAWNFSTGLTSVEIALLIKS